MPEESANSDKLIVVAMGIIVSIVIGAAIRLFARDTTNITKFISTGIPLIINILFILVSITIIFLGSFFMKFNFKNIINLIRYKKWINLNKKVISEINNANKGNKKEYTFNKIIDNVSQDIFFYNKRNMYHYQKENNGIFMNLIFTRKEIYVSIPITKAITYYQKYGNYFYKLINIDEKIVQKKITQIENIDKLIRLSNNFNKYSQKDVAEMDNKKEFLEKQLEEMMYLFNNKLLNKHFESKYLQTSLDLKSKRINYKIQEVFH